MRNNSIKVLCSILIAVTIVGCNQGTQQEKKTVAENIFRYSIATEPTSLDPAFITDGDTYTILQQCTDTLVILKGDKKIHPHLIEEMPTIENDGKTYVFKLKKGIKFINGKELRAEDVKWTIERNTAQSLASPTASSYLDDIVGVKERLEGKKTPIGVEVRDPYTVAFNLVGPRAFFLGKLTFPVSAILCKGVVPEEKITSPAQLVATGPFILKEYKKGGHIFMIANKNYFAGAPKLDGILRLIIKDPITRFNKYRNGDLDMISLERSDIEAVESDPTLKSELHFYDRPAMYYLAMNENEVPAFRNVKVRQAIMMAIDKDHIVRDILKNANTVANSILPPVMPGYRKDTAAPKFNINEARKLLSAAGYGPDKKNLTFPLSYRAERADLKLVAENIQRQLKKNLGIDVKANPMDWVALQAARSQKAIKAVHMRWLNDYLDPENSISLFFTTNGGQNTTGYSNREVDALCKKADSSLDQNERMNLYAKAEDIILREGTFVPLYFQRDAILIQPYVHGLEDGLLEFAPMTNVTLDKK